jgi:hypothetical protein
LAHSIKSVTRREQVAGNCNTTCQNLHILAWGEAERLDFGAVGTSKRREGSSAAIRTNRYRVRDVANDGAGIQPEDRADFGADEDHMAAFRTGGETQFALAVAAGTTRLQKMPRRGNNSHSISLRSRAALL